MLRLQALKYFLLVFHKRVVVIFSKGEGKSKGKHISGRRIFFSFFFRKEKEECEGSEGESKANCKRGIRVNQKKKEGLRGVQEKRISYTVLTTFQLILIVEVSNSIARKMTKQQKK